MFDKETRNEIGSVDRVRCHLQKYKRVPFWWEALPKSAVAELGCKAGDGRRWLAPMVFGPRPFRSARREDASGVLSDPRVQQQQFYARLDVCVMTRETLSSGPVNASCNVPSLAECGQGFWLRVRESRMRVMIMLWLDPRSPGSAGGVANGPSPTTSFSRLE